MKFPTEPKNQKSCVKPRTSISILTHTQVPVPTKHQLYIHHAQRGNQLDQTHAIPRDVAPSLLEFLFGYVGMKCQTTLERVQAKVPPLKCSHNR